MQPFQLKFIKIKPHAPTATKIIFLNYTVGMNSDQK